MQKYSWALLGCAMLLCVAFDEAIPSSIHKNLNTYQSKDTMTKQDYHTSILVDQSPEEVYQAINHVRAWWSEQIEGPTDQLNQSWFYQYKDIHLCKMKVIGLEPNKKVEWEVLENHFSFIEEQEWVGNHLVFEISKEGEKTRLDFTQVGLTQEEACFDVCRDGWNNYIKHSLFLLITTGQGAPNPKEGEGFNKELADRWNIK